LRTLVNHLMTIATWQAKVTATLIGDEESDEGPDTNDEVYSVAPTPEHHPVAPAPEHHAIVAGPERNFASRDTHAGGSAEARPDNFASRDTRAGTSAEPRPNDFVDRVAKHVEPRRPEPRLPSRRSAPTTLDDDIDDILGTDRDPSSEDSSAPPDFGI
jgi:hypothetical protein